MPIIRAAQAPLFDLEGIHFRGLTSPSRGATELCTWRLEMEPGAVSVAHRLTHEEVFLPLAGTLSVVLDGEAAEVSPGDACAVPAQCLLQVANQSRETVSVLVCISTGFRATTVDGQHIGTPPWAQ